MEAGPSELTDRQQHTARRQGIEHVGDQLGELAGDLIGARVHLRRHTDHHLGSQDREH
jgi:hypothetical protein